MPNHLTAGSGRGPESAPADDRTSIEIWLHDYPFPGFLDPVRTAAEAFNEAHPEHRVSIVGKDFRTMPSAVARAVEEGAPPAAAEFTYTSTRTALDLLGSDGDPLFTTIGQALGARSEVLGEPVRVEDIVAPARDYFRFDGVQAALPQTASTVVLYANVDLLAAAGVTEVPRTWSELGTACRAVTRMPGGPPHGVAWPNHFWFFLQSLAQQGGLLADHDNGRSGRAEQVRLDSPEMMSYVSWWQRLHRDGSYYYSGKRSDWNSCFEEFIEQRVAFIMSSSVDAARLTRTGAERGFTVEVGPMPHNDEVSYVGNMIGGDGIWIADGVGSRVRDGVTAFLQHLIRPKAAAHWHRFNNRLPITHSSVDLLDAEGWFQRNPGFRAATDQIAASAATPASLGPVLGNFPAVGKEITVAMHDVLTAGSDPAGRFAAAGARIQRLVDDDNAHCVGATHRRTPKDLKVAW